MTTPNFTPDWNTTDVYVSRDGTEWRFVEDDDGATYPILLASMKNDEQYWFTRDGRYVFAIECHQRDIVKQVPNGDFHAFARAQSEWSQATFGTDLLRGPIGPLKHLAKEAAEAQENPTDVMEFADCLFLTLDASRRAGFSSEALLRAAWEKLTINEAREWPKVTDANAAVEHVREATPATAATDAGEVPATTPKWPRYFEPKELRGIRDRIKFIDPFYPVWADGSSSPVALCRSIKDINMNDYIETDADGNALAQPVEPQQQASGVESKVDEVVMLAQDAAFARRDKSLFMVKEGSKFVSADRFIEAEAELASIKREYIEDASTNRQRIDDHEVLIAKLRRRLAARDATIAELTKSGEQASSIRDGALAVCKNSHELVLGLINERNGLKKQLAAANERVAAVEKESKGWHGVVVECEKILKAVGTAEKPLTSNLPNLIRDRLLNLHRAEEAVAALAKERDGLREQVYELKNGDQP